MLGVQAQNYGCYVMYDFDKLKIRTVLVNLITLGAYFSAILLVVKNNRNEVFTSKKCFVFYILFNIRLVPVGFIHQWNIPNLQKYDFYYLSSKI